jgi:cytochrome c553
MRPAALARAGLVPEARPAAPAAPPDPAAEEESRFVTMPAHFLDLEKAREALVSGELDQAKRIVARVVTDTKGGVGPPDWRGYVDAIAAEGERFVNAQLLSEAALSLGTIGHTCGECHAFAGKGPGYEPRMPPTQGKAVKDRMLVHDWGARKLWEGLVVPSPDAWEQGAQALAEAPLWRTGEVEGEELPEAVRSYEVQVREHARDAVGAEPSAELFAGVVATCSGCHLVARR